MEDLITAAEALIIYIEEENVYDTSDDDSDGRVDHSQSHEFRGLVNDLHYAIEDASDALAAIKLIKEGFITMIQTAIARQ